MFNLSLATASEQIHACFRVMALLRPEISEPQFVASVARQQRYGYQLLMLKTDQQVLGVAGFRLAENLAWGKHLYIDDLVTDADKRSQGVGQALLDWLSDYARAKGCEEIHLDSGVQRFLAHKFYLKADFAITSHHFAKSLVN